MVSNPLLSNVCKSASVSVVNRPNCNFINQNYTCNCEPLASFVFIKLPLGAVKPKGWLLKQIKLQVDGFHDHLIEISNFLQKDNNA